MSADCSLDELLRRIYSLSREDCKAELRQIDRPRLDFTDEYLDQMSIDHLRHVVAAACIQQRRAKIS